MDEAERRDAEAVVVIDGKTWVGRILLVDFQCGDWFGAMLKFEGDDFYMVHHRLRDLPTKNKGPLMRVAAFDEQKALAKMLLMVDKLREHYGQNNVLVSSLVLQTADFDTVYKAINERFGRSNINAAGGSA